MRVLDRWRRPTNEFAKPDRLTRAIQRAIDELLAEGVIQRKFAEEPEDEDDQYNGFCARAVQVYWRLTREPEYRYLAADLNVEPYKLGKGPDAHYWIRTASGKVLDLNLGPRDAPNRRYPYHHGSVGPASSRMRKARTSHNMDARVIMDRVMANETAAPEDRS